MNIHGYPSVSSIGQSPQAPDVGKTSTSSGGDFGSILKAYTSQVNHDIKSAAHAGENLALGKGGSTSETLLAIKEAGLSMQLMLGVRNKLVDAYREISRMQV
ncbi:MAG: flagellar hook-basal body complex protein FliE [Mariprofundus sp.]|nr:flagellar hook-basal body complex protein FliE [Mariprofundus sp.]